MFSILFSSILSTSLSAYDPLDFIIDVVTSVGDFARVSAEVSVEAAGQLINAAPELIGYMPSRRLTKAGAKMAYEIVWPKRARPSARAGSKSQAANQLRKAIRAEVQDRVKDEVKTEVKAEVKRYLPENLALETLPDNETISSSALEPTSPVPQPRKLHSPARKRELAMLEAKTRGYAILASKVEASTAGEFFQCDHVMRTPQRTVACVEIKSGPYDDLTSFQRNLGLADGQVKTISFFGSAAEQAGLPTGRPLRIRTEIWCFNNSPACGDTSMQK